MRGERYLGRISYLIVNQNEPEILCYTKCSMHCVGHLNLCLEWGCEWYKTFKEGIFFANVPLTFCYNCPR